MSHLSAAEALKEQVFESVSSLPREEASSGDPGVSIKAIRQAVSRSDTSVRKAVEALVEGGRLREVGKVDRGRKLYGVVST